MYKKLICAFVVVLVLSLTNTASAELVAQWKLDDGAGTTALDASGNGNNGTLEGGPTVVNGQFGLALAFANSRVTIPASASLNANLFQGSFTLTAWINPKRTGNTWQQVFRAIRTDNASNDTLFLNSDGRLSWRGRVGAAWAGGMCETAANVVPADQWTHVAVTGDGTNFRIYVNGALSQESAFQKTDGTNATYYIGGDPPTTGESYTGMADDLRVYNHVLSQDNIRSSMENQGGALVKAYSPNPKDDTLHADTWVTLSWKPGDFAASHDVYLGDNFDDVNNATPAGATFRGNQAGTFYVAGFPGFAYPDGLVPGTTYYWRIDEVNTTDPNSPWKGDVWSFSIPPKTAYNPNPADGAESVALDVKLSWTAGFKAKLHTVYFGDNSDTVANAAGGPPQGTATYSPSGLKMAKSYYWRVDEFDGVATYKGDIWSFTTQGAVGNPQPANGAVDVKQTPTLSWTPGAYAGSHEVYLGTNADAVRNATKTSPEFKATKILGDESYAPGKLAWETIYYWRIDEVNNVNPDSPWVGKVWSFTTADYAVIDDFEDYDAADNQIWYAWHDGLGYGVPGTPPYFAGNGTGAAVGDETTASFTEETIVHGGSRSMPLNYDNNKQGFAKYSEAELTLTSQRDWTEEGVGELSIWFRGRAGSVGSFAEAPAGTYTMTASGADIWNNGPAGNRHDEFHYAYKTLTGAGSIVARVQSVQNTNGWAKAGVMIRETLDGGSKHAFACVTPANGVASQGRDTTGGDSFNTAQGGITAPYWVKLERDAAGNFTVSHSANGTAWQPVTGATPRNIPMSATVYIGLALTSHDATRTCQAVFTNVTTTGTVSPQWAHQDIGIASNAAEPLYVAVSNAAGQPAVVVHSDPAAAQITTWTEWVVPLSAFADKGINLKNVDKLALGLGNRGNMTAPGGSGKMYFDDIRLNRPRTP